MSIYRMSPAAIPVFRSIATHTPRKVRGQFRFERQPGLDGLLAAYDAERLPGVRLDAQ